MNIFDEITEHLLNDNKPSYYLKTLAMDSVPTFRGSYRNHNQKFIILKVMYGTIPTGC